MLKSLLLSSIVLGTASAQWPPWRTTTRSDSTPTTTSSSPSAVQTLYGQCGGVNWTGPTRCPPGAYCKNDGNIWYSQCVAIEDGDEQSSVTLRTSSTTVTAGPTIITTFITYLTPTRTTPTSTSVVTVTLRPDEPCDHPYLC